MMMCGTYLPPGVGGAQALGLTGFDPGLEELFEHGGLSTLAHGVHVGTRRVILGFDETLRRIRQMVRHVVYL